MITQLMEFMSNHPLLTTAWVVLFFLLVFNIIKSQFSSIKYVSPTELIMLINRENATVVDIRKEDEFKQGHITDARHLLPADIQKQQLSGLEKKKDEPIIVVCQAGLSAQKAASDLKKQGFSHVSVLRGGMSSWSGANLPVVKTKR